MPHAAAAGLCTVGYRIGGVQTGRVQTAGVHHSAVPAAFGVAWYCRAELQAPKPYKACLSSQGHERKRPWPYSLLERTP